MTTPTILPGEAELIASARKEADQYPDTDLALHVQRLADALEKHLDSPSQPEGWKPTHRHVMRRTLYEVLGTARVQSQRPLTDEEVVIVYQNREGVTWVRGPHEFNDGRFEPLAASPLPPGEAVEEEDYNPEMPVGVAAETLSGYGPAVPEAQPVREVTVDVVAKAYDQSRGSHGPSWGDLTDAGHQRMVDFAQAILDLLRGKA